LPRPFAPDLPARTAVGAAAKPMPQRLVNAPHQPLWSPAALTPRFQMAPVPLAH
jgi:hypothetical protein